MVTARFKKILITTTGLFVFTTCIYAGEQTPPQMNLPECIGYAIKNQIDVFSGHIALSNAKADMKKAKSEYMPIVSVGYSENRYDPDQISLQNKTVDEEQMNISVGLNIYNSGAKRLNLQSARAAYAYSNYSETRIKQTTAYKVTSCYIRFLQTKKLAEIQTARVKMLEEQLEMVRSGIAAGMDAEIDALPIEAQLSNAKVDELSAANAILAASVDLQNAMGIKVSDEFSVSDIEDRNQTDIMPFEYYEQSAHKNRTDIQGAREYSQMYMKTKQIAKIQLRPHLLTNASFNQEVGSVKTDVFNITAGVYYDIYDGGKNLKNYQIATNNYLYAEAKREQLEKDILSDVRKAYFDLIDSSSRLEAGSLSYDAAIRNYDMQQARFREGLSVTLDLLNAQYELVSAQNNVAKARYDFLQAQALMEYVTGTWGKPNEN